MAFNYFFNDKGVVGSRVGVFGFGGSTNYYSVIQAMTLSDSSGNELGTAASPLVVSAATPAAAAGTTVTGTLASATSGTAFTPLQGFGQGRFDLMVSGTFVATWVVERSIDGGTTYTTATNGGVAQSFTGLFNEVLIAGGTGELVRIRVTAYTSGTLTYRFSQKAT